MAIGAILLARPSLARKSLQDGGEEIYRNGTEGSNPACSSAESAANRSHVSGPGEADLAIEKLEADEKQRTFRQLPPTSWPRWEKARRRSKTRTLGTARGTGSAPSHACCRHPG